MHLCPLYTHKKIKFRESKYVQGDLENMWKRKDWKLAICLPSPSSSQLLLCPSLVNPWERLHPCLKHRTLIILSKVPMLRKAVNQVAMEDEVTQIPYRVNDW